MSDPQLFQLNYVAPPTVADFMQAKSFVKGIMGPMGSGKSSGCCLHLFQLALDQPPSPIDGVRRSRSVIVRNTYNELESTTIQTFNDWFPPDVWPGYYLRTRPPKRLIRFALDDGSVYHMEFWFIALDREEHVRKLKSLEMTFAWVNEATEVPWPIIKMLMLRLGRYPGKRHGGAPNRCLIMDANPPPVQSWWHDLFEKKRTYPIFKQPSGLSPQAENIENLPPGYYTEMIATMEPEEINVLIHGQYGRTKKGEPVYGEHFNEAMHVSKEPLNALPKEMGRPLVVGIDYGLTPAAVIGQQSPDMRWRLLREVVPLADNGKSLRIMGAEQFAPLLKQYLAAEFGADYPVQLWGDPAGNHRSQADSTQTATAMMWKHGLNVHPAPTNAIDARVLCVKMPLQRMIAGMPGFLVDARCQRTIAALSGDYHYKRTKLMGITNVSKDPEKNDASHVANALEYMLSGGGEFINIRRKDSDILDDSDDLLINEPMLVDVGFNPLNTRVGKYEFSNDE